MENRQTPFIARRKEREQLQATLQAAQNGSGTLMFVRSETGYGKTALLESIVQEVRAKQNVDVVRVECQPPIGALNVSSIQPMQPWVKGLEMLVDLNAGSAKKRLVVNIGLSVLGLIPIAGSIFDMTKEVMRDLREYRADKKNNKEATSAGDKLMTEFHDALMNIATQRPFVMMLDDAQWMDAQSVEFLHYLTRHPAKRPFSIILSFQQGMVDVKNPALAAWLQERRPGVDISGIDLQAFTSEEISESIRATFPKQARQPAFEDWMMRRTAGIPITVVEYLQYFQRNSPFREDGSLDAERLTSQSIPASLQALFAKNIESLSEQDINMLALCSAEGREFTVFIIAKLMNTDTLSAIKKLKSLQYRTGLIRSTGAHARYGARTTVYEFTQALHHTYFHSTLEHEERVELHDRIAAILRVCYENTKDEQLQRQLAPYIAAHALEAGDEATARTMLVESAHTAEISGSQGIVGEIIEAYSDLAEDTGGAIVREERDELHHIAQTVGLEPTPESTHILPPQPESSQTDIPDCNVVREDVLDLYFAGKFEEASFRAQDFLHRSGELISRTDMVLLLAMAARAEIENQRLSQAEELLTKAQHMLHEQADDYAQCIIENVVSIHSSRSGDSQQCMLHLQQAARSASATTDDLKLLTVSNIALALKSSNPRQSRLFERIARQLSFSLHFHEFRESIFSAES